jgi:hypothetical protein
MATSDTVAIPGSDIRRFVNPLSYPVLHFAHPVLQRGLTSAHPAALNSLAWSSCATAMMSSGRI